MTPSKQFIEEQIERLEGELEIIEKLLEKSREIVAVGHKNVYETVKTVSNYKGKQEVLQLEIDYWISQTKPRRQ